MSSKLRDKSMSKPKQCEQIFNQNYNKNPLESINIFNKLLRNIGKGQMRFSSKSNLTLRKGKVKSINKKTRSDRNEKIQ